jgi:membrane protein
MQRRNSWIRHVVRAVSNFQRDRCFDRAAVIAYFALLSFLPLAVVLVAVGALLLGSVEAAERGTELLLRNVLYALPPQVMTQVRSLQQGIWSGLFYLPIAVWSASTVLNKIEAGLNHVFEVEQPRHWALRKLLAFGVVGLLSVLLVAAMVVGGILATVDRFIDVSALAALRDAPLYHTVNGFVSRYLVPWVIAVLAFFLVYWIVPARKVPARAAFTAAFIAGTLWEGLKIGLTYYASHIASYTRTYGALATVVIFLLWVNLSAVLLLWGGELAAVLSGHRGSSEAQGGSG